MFYSRDEIYAIYAIMGRLKECSDSAAAKNLDLGSIDLLDNTGKRGTFHSVDDGQWEFESGRQ